MNARLVQGGGILVLLALGLSVWLAPGDGRVEGVGPSGAAAPVEAPAQAAVELQRIREDVEPAAERVAVEALGAQEAEDRTPVASEGAAEEQRFFYGRALDDADGSPIAGVRVAAFDGDLTGDVSAEDALAESDADGLFRLQLVGVVSDDRHRWMPAASFRGRTISRFAVRGPAYAPAIFMLDDEHATPEDALPLPLARGAELVVTVRRRGVTIEDRVDLRLEAPSRGVTALAPYGTIFGDPSWSATGLMGVACGIADLPPRVELRLTVRWNGLVRPWPEPIVLAPGERRGLEVRLDGATLRGRLLDGTSGEGLAHVEVWLAARGVDDDPPPRSRFFHSSGGSVGGDVLVEAITDEAGRFTLEDVRPGPYWIGPAAQGRFSADAARVSPVATPLEVPPGLAVLDVDLVGWTDGAIEGRVMTPEGGTAARPWVILDSEEVAGSLFVLSASDDGRFATGPLPPAEYTLRAQSMAFAPSDTVRARAGDDDVVLELGRGGGVRVTLVEGGKTVRGELRVVSGPDTLRSTSGSGELGLSGLVEGTYTFFARTVRGRGALLRDVIVRDGETTDLGAVALAPAAELAVSYRGPRGDAVLTVLYEGAPIAYDSLRPNVPSIQVVPTERLTVQVRCGDEQREQEVTLVPGERREVVFDFEDD